MAQQKETYSFMLQDGRRVQVRVMSDKTVQVHNGEEWITVKPYEPAK